MAARKHPKSVMTVNGAVVPAGRRLFESLLLGVCLLVIAIRATVTESVMGSTGALPGETSDALYTLTLSGLLILGFGVWLIDGVVSGRLVYRWGGFEIGAAVFLAGALIAGCLASDKRAATTATAAMMAPVLMAALLVQVLNSRLRIHLVLCVLAGLATATVYQGLEQHFISNDVTIQQYEQNPREMLGALGIEPGTFDTFLFEHRLYSRGVRGFFTTRNSAGCFLLIGLFAVASMLILPRRPRGGAGADETRSLLLRCLVVAAMLGTLVLTLSKGAFLGLATGAVLWLALARCGDWVRRHRWKLLIGILVVACAATAAVAGHGLAHGSLPGGNSMLVRWQYWHATGRMVADHPAGVGGGNFGTHYTHYKPDGAIESVRDPHNFTLSMLGQYGPLGLAGFLLMVIGPLWRWLGVCSQEVSERCDDAKGLPKDCHPEPSEGSGRRRKEILRCAQNDRSCFEMVSDGPGAARFVGVFGAVLAVCLVVLRYRLVPVSAGDAGLDVAIYIAVTMYVAPVAAFVIGLAIFGGPLRRTGDAASGLHLQRVAVAVCCAVVAVLVQNLIDFAVFEPGVYTAMWAMIGCLGACVHVADRPQACPTSLRGAARVGLAAVVAAAVVVFGVVCYLPVYRSTVHIRLAHVAIVAGNLDRAHTQLEAAVQADTWSDEALSLDGKVYLRQYEQSARKDAGLLEAAGARFDLAGARNPADYKHNEKLAQVYELAGDTAKAREMLAEAIRKYPGSARLEVAMGRLLDPDVAAAHYRRTVEIEDAFREQFRRMYPDRELVSRLGQDVYEDAKARMGEPRDGR